MGQANPKHGHRFRTDTGEAFELNLSGARGPGTNFSRANLSHAKFRSSDFSEADFSFSFGAKANFERADLHNADFSRAVLTGANFRYAKLKGANFTGAVLSGADLSNADLTDTVLSDAVVEDADFSYAKLSVARCENLNMSTVKGLTWDQFLETRFDETTIPPKHLKGETLLEILERLYPDLPWRQNYSGSLKDFLTELSGFAAKFQNGSPFDPMRAALIRHALKQEDTQRDE